MITDKVGGSSAKPEVSKQSKEKRLKHKVSGYKSQSKRRSIAGCRLLLRTLTVWKKTMVGPKGKHCFRPSYWCLLSLLKYHSKCSRDFKNLTSIFIEGVECTHKYWRFCSANLLWPCLLYSSWMQIKSLGKDYILL